MESFCFWGADSSACFGMFSRFHQRVEGTGGFAYRPGMVHHSGAICKTPSPFHPLVKTRKHAETGAGIGPPETERLHLRVLLTLDKEFRVPWFNVGTTPVCLASLRAA